MPAWIGREVMESIVMKHRHGARRKSFLKRANVCWCLRENAPYIVGTMTIRQLGFTLVAALLGTVMLIQTGCSSTSGGSQRASGAGDPTVLAVGVAPSLPPIIYEDAGEFRGLEADLARALAQELGRRVEFVEMSWEKLPDALSRGRIDIIMSGMTITPERSMRVNFTTPYLRSGQTALVRRTDLAKLQLMLFSGENRFGAQRDTTGDFFVQRNQPSSTRFLYRKPEDGARALRRNEIDVFVHDAPINWWLASENQNTGLTVINSYLTEEYLAWAVGKDNSALLSAANAFLQKARSDGRLDPILKRWVPFQ